MSATLLRLGSIRYINSLPVDLGLLKKVIPLNARIVQGSPMRLNELILSDELDVSPVSLFWFALHSEKFYLLPDLSISSESAVHSVLLFSHYPLSDLKGKKIAVCDEGSTTPALLEILCRQRYGFVPDLHKVSSNFGQIPEGFDAILLLGDLALSRKASLSDRTILVTDLAEEWHAWTGTPFVFAVWVVRREFFSRYPDSALAAHQALLRSREWGTEHFEEVVRHSREKTELGEDLLRFYFSNLRYRLDEPAKKGILIFLEYAAQCGLLQKPVVMEEMAPVLAASQVTIRSGRSIEDILDDALEGKRVTVDEGVKLYYEADLHQLGAAADWLCRQKNPGSDKRATFLVDRNINYTNYCYTLCKFCAFYRLPGDKNEGYVRSQEEIRQKIEELTAIGGTQVLLQGGHNPDLGIEYYEDLVRFVRKNFPQVHVHSFSASEVIHMAKISKISIREVLVRLKEAGLNSFPGGGAEILSDRVRQIVSPLKTKVADYFEVHRTAHEVGLISTGTMVYGLGETIEERMIHFDHYRRLQDETRGFRAFIPWSFESESTQMSMPRRTGAEYLRMVALSRLLLDNIQHLQAGWVTEGPKLSQVALSYGADDFGGILMEENVVSATKSDKLYSGVTKEEAIRLIREAGKIPVQRNTNYEIVIVYPPTAPVSLATA